MNRKSIRKHFRTDSATIDHIYSDFSYNRITNKDEYIRYIVNNRIDILNKNYNIKLDRILNFIIINCRYDNLPIDSILKIIKSLSRITDVLSKGFLSIIDTDKKIKNN